MGVSSQNRFNFMTRSTLPFPHYHSIFIQIQPKTLFHKTTITEEKTPKKKKKKLTRKRNDKAAIYIETTNNFFVFLYYISTLFQSWQWTNKIVSIYQRKAVLFHRNRLTNTMSMNGFHYICIIHSWVHILVYVQRVYNTRIFVSGKMLMWRESIRQFKWKLNFHECDNFSLYIYTMWEVNSIKKIEFKKGIA